MPREYSLEELQARAKKSQPKEYSLEELTNLGATPKPTPTKKDAVISPETSHLADSAFTSESELKPSSWLDGFLGDTMRGLTRGAAIGSGALAGGTMSGGNPLGVALGGVAGDQAYQMGQRGAASMPGGGTEVWGKAPSNPVDSMTESTLQALLEVGGGKVVNKLSGLFKTGRRGFVDNFFAKQAMNSAEDVKALNANPDVPMTVGQATKGKLASWLEDVLMGGKKQKEFIDPAQDIFKNKALKYTKSVSGKGTDYTDPNFPVELGRKAVKSAQFEAERTQGVVDRLYTDLRKSLGKNDVDKVITTKKGSGGYMDYDTGQTIGGTPDTKEIKDVVGPIYLNRSFDAAKNFSNIIDETIKSYTEKNFPEEAINSLRKAKSLIDPILTAEKNVQGNPVLGYEDHKALRSIAHTINNKMEGVDDLTKKKLGGIAGDLEDLLTVDKKDSINQFWSKESRDIISRADKYFQARAKRYDPAIAKQLQGLDPDVAQEQLMNHALGNVENARKYIKLVGSRNELGAHHVASVFKEIENEGHFYGGALQNKLTRDPGVFRTTLSSAQRQGLEYLGRTMDHIQPRVSDAGKYSLAFRGGTAALTILPAALDIAQGDAGGDTFFKSGAILGVLFGGKKFAEKYLLNPTKARQIAILARTPPGTPKANSLSRAIFGTGKVAQANLRELMVDSVMHSEEGEQE
jgi:hypothetical protein